MTECASTIAEVCVYPGQAQIVRRGRVQLEIGQGEVLIGDLPLALQPETVRVSGRGTARARLLGVEVNQTRYAEAPEEALLELDKQIERLEDQDRALAAQVEVLNRRLEVLAELGKASAERLPWGMARGTVDTIRVADLLALLRQGEEEARSETLKLEIERRELSRELERLRRQRQDRAQPQIADRYAVRVPVEVSQAGELEIELVYVCQNATWGPLYDLRLDDKAEGGPQVALGQLAEISQTTGEDWKSVKLAVSTARPALASRLPELSPWYIDLYRPQPKRRYQADTAAAPQFFTAGAAPGEPSPVQAEAGEKPVPMAQATIAAAEVRSEGPAIVFVAPGTPSIPADGSSHKVVLGTQDLPAPLDWVAAPKAEQHVYRRAKVVNATPAVLLPGQATIFYGETFLGSTTVPETPPQAEFEVYLGVDDRVKVERELVDQTVDKSGVLEKLRRMLFTYRIKLHNYRPERVALTVLDQVPVSQDESLKVKLLRSDPQVQPADLGELRWELNLAPEEERVISFTFQVDMPVEGEVVGL